MESAKKVSEIPAFSWKKAKIRHIKHLKVRILIDKKAGDLRNATRDELRLKRAENIA